MAATFVYAADSMMADCGDRVQISARPAAGWHFVKWDDDNTDNPRTIMAHEDKHFMAIFEHDDCIITVVGDNGEVTGSGTYPYQTSVTITAVPDECYEFVRWSDEAEGATSVGATRTIIATDNTTYTAIFRKIQYTITTGINESTAGEVELIRL